MSAARELQASASSRTPSAVYVLGVVEAVLRGDWELARWSHRQAVMARVSALFDDGHDVIPPAERDG